MAFGRFQDLKSFLWNYSVSYFYELHAYRTFVEYYPKWFKFSIQYIQEIINLQLSMYNISHITRVQQSSKRYMKTLARRVCENTY